MTLRTKQPMTKQPAKAEAASWCVLSLAYLDHRPTTLVASGASIRFQSNPEEGT